MSSIRLFYHGPNKGKINFGDALSPILVREITGRDVAYSSIFKCELIGVGSILDTYFRWRLARALLFNGNAIIWGSGFIKEGPKRHPEGLVIAAVRGPDTRERLHLSPSVPIGDPGLLASMLTQRCISPRYSWGIIPHLADAKDQRVQLLLNNTKHSTLIRLDEDPIQTLKRISQCERIISSSLHGLVVADALNIPNWRIRFGNNVIGGSWKFNDYFNSVQKSNRDSIFSPASGNLEKSALPEEFSYWDRIPQIRQDLIDALKRFY